jgi:hypothetical protein
MSKTTNRAALALLGALGAAVTFTAPALAEDPPYELSCSAHPSVNCAPDRQAAHNGVATVPGIRPLQPLTQDVARAQARPWQGHPTNPPRGGAGS